MFSKARAPRPVVLALGLCLLVAVALAGCAKGMDEFRQVKQGMTLEEVRALLGNPDEVQEAAGVAAVWVYRSKAPLGDGSELTVTSLGGKVMLTAISKGGK